MAPPPLLSSPALVTDSYGGFQFAAPATCPTQSSLVYLSATGGNPGFAAGTNNPALAVLDVIGTCNTLTSSTFLSINEVTTVAAVNALAPYVASFSAIGSSPAHAPALAAAFTLATQFASSSTGTSPGDNLPPGHTAPQTSIYTLANIIAPCVNSTGADGSCTSLFSLTTPANAPAPTDTVQALLNVANNPTLNTPNLFNLAAPSSPFQPYLPAAPPTLAIALVPNSTTLSFSTVTFPTATLTYTTPQQDMVVTNTGTVNAVFAPTSFTLSGSNAADFDQLNNCTILAPGASCDVLITATPTATATGTRTATLTANANLIQPQSVALSATGQARSSGPLSFTSYAYNYSGGAYSDLTVSNTGTGTVTFQTLGGVAGLPSTCGATLAGGASCVISYIGNTDRTGTSTVTLVDDAINSPQTATIYNQNQSSVSFGTLPATPLGSSSALVVYVQSASNSIAASIRGTLSGVAAADYSPSTVGCDGSGAPYSTAFETCSFTVTFTPSVAGPRPARISLNGSNYIPLNGNTPAAVVTTPPASAPFTVGTSGTLYATIDNLGNATATGSLTISNTSANVETFPTLPIFSKSPGIFSQTNNCATLAAGATCTVQITIHPTISGSVSATLLARDTTSGVSAMGTINTTTSYHVPVITPTSTLTLPAQPVGTTGATQTFTIADEKGVPLGHPLSLVYDYSGSSNPSAGPLPGGNTPDAITLPAGTSCPASTTAICTLSVAATPTTTDAVYVYYHVVDQFTGYTTPITFLVVGTTPPTATLTSSSLSFPSTLGGSSSTSQNRITNSGSLPLAISSIAVTGAVDSNFTQTNTCGTALAAGSSCIINLTFTPKVPGPQTAAVQILSNAASSPDSFSLSGTGVSNAAPTALLGISAAGFPFTSVGSTATLSTTLRNSGMGTLTISSISLPGAVNSNFTQTNNCGTSLAGGATCNINLAFSPKVTGPQAATLQVLSNAASSPNTASLTGTGK